MSLRPDSREACKAVLVTAIAAALGVSMSACGGSNKGATSPNGAASGSATEVRVVHERPQRDAHCGRD